VSSSGYVAASAEGRRPVSRAHRSTLLQSHTDERPSFPSGFGKPAPPARTFTRCGDIPRRRAMSTSITSSVRESTCTTSGRPERSGVMGRQPVFGTYGSRGHHECLATEPSCRLPSRTSPHERAHTLCAGTRRGSGRCPDGS